MNGPHEDGIALDLPEVVKQFAERAVEQPLHSELEWILLDTVLDQLPVGVLLVDAAQKRVILRNRKFNEISQMPHITYFKEYEKYFSAYDRQGKKYSPDEFPIMRSINSGETVVDEEVVFKTEDGSSFVLSVNSAPILDKRGSLIAAAALYGDISSRAASTSQMKFLGDAGTALAGSLDRRVIMQKITELVVQDIADGCAMDLLSERGELKLAAADYKEPQKMVYADGIRRRGYLDKASKIGAGTVLRTGRSVLYHRIKPSVLEHIAAEEEYMSILRESGVCSCVVVPIKSKEGAFIGAISITSASEEKLFDEKHVRLLEELAKKIALTLENIELYESARRAITLRDDFITIASHELKTPIATMLSYEYLLSKRLEAIGDKELKENLDEINTQLWNLSNLINQMLDLSRIQGGKFVYTKAMFNMNELVHEIVELEQKTTDKHTVEEVPCKRGTAYGDREHIGHVLSNFISNAIKFSPGGKIIVSGVTVGDEITVSVQDFGMGIPKEQQGKIFERFHQVADKKNKSRPGLGIGLYIASEIIKNHGGSIWYESEAGKGSTFYFKISTTDKNDSA